MDTTTRLERLEKSVRRWRLLTIGCLILMVCCAASSTIPRNLKVDRIQAQMFSLIDSRGKVHGLWNCEDDYATFALMPAGATDYSLTLLVEGEKGRGYGRIAAIDETTGKRAILDPRNPR